MWDVKRRSVKLHTTTQSQALQSHNDHSGDCMTEL